MRADEKRRSRGNNTSVGRKEKGVVEEGLQVHTQSVLGTSVRPHTQVAGLHHTVDPLSASNDGRRPLFLGPRPRSDPASSLSSSRLYTSRS